MYKKLSRSLLLIALLSFRAAGVAHEVSDTLARGGRAQAVP
jgi:hypothetical protein